MMKDWHVVGQRVVSIVHWHATLPSVLYPTKGNVFTIREVRADSVRQADDVFFTLVEIVNENPIGGTEPAFHESGFRPVRPTSIESLRAMLDPKPSMAREDA